MANSTEGVSKVKHYLSANVLTTIAGLITFPVLTRLLSKADYGIYSLIQGVQLLFEAVLKGGGQLSIFRFYSSEYLEDTISKKRFVSTLLVFPLLVSSIVSLIACIIVIFYSYFYLENYFAILVVVSAQSGVVLSYFKSFMQASGLSKYDSVITVVYKYLYLIIVIPAVMFILTNYWGVYWSVAISTFITSCVTIWINRSIFKYVSLNVDKALLISALKFSIPLFLTELSILSISYADRLVMALLEIEMSDIGIFAIGFGLANVLFMLIWKTIQPSIFPTVNKLHDTVGVNESVIYLSKSANLYVLFIVSVITGIGLNSEEFVIILCGQDKSEAGIYFFLGTSLLLFRLVGNFIFYGIELCKETKYIFYSELAVAIINVFLNVFFIYFYGMYGAVFASFLSVVCGMFLKKKALKDEYYLKSIFSGFPKLLFVMFIYSVIHVYVIELYFQNPVFIMASSISLFLIIMVAMKGFWIDRFKNVFGK